jgi:hypothetical protein
MRANVAAAQQVFEPISRINCPGMSGRMSSRRSIERACVYQ